MNKDITVMIELQRYWDNVLRCRSDIEKSEKSIFFWKNQIDEKLKLIFTLEDEIKHNKLSVKEKEIELSEKDEQIKKLDKRKDIIKNEKEMTALNHEINKVKTDKDDLENKLIELFDTIEKKEADAETMKAELRETERQSSVDIHELEDRINRFNKSIDENQQKFDGIIDQLSPIVKTKFTKLIKSQNGRAIASVQGEICGACNFQIPFNLIQDILKENNIVNCTNCGRFLFIEKSSV